MDLCCDDQMTPFQGPRQRSTLILVKREARHCFRSDGGTRIKKRALARDRGRARAHADSIVVKSGIWTNRRRSRTVLKDDLQKSFMFARLDEAQLDRVAAHAVKVRLDDGEMLFRQNDAAGRFYMLLRGQVKLFRLGPSGNEKVIEIVTPYSTFAEALMFLDRPVYPVGAQSLQAAEVISIDAVDFSRMLRESVETCFMLLGDMSQRLRGLIREIDDLSLSSATCRVAAYLLTRSPPEGTSFDLQVPKQTLASRLSVQPETFSRIIRNLSDQGVLSMHGSRVEIADPARLQQIANVCTQPEVSLADTFRYPCPPPKSPN